MKRLYLLFVVFAFACGGGAKQTKDDLAEAPETAKETDIESDIEPEILETEPGIAVEPWSELTDDDRELLDFLASDPEGWVDIDGRFQFRVWKDEDGRYWLRHDGVDELIMTFTDDGMLETAVYDDLAAGRLRYTSYYRLARNEDESAEFIVYIDERADETVTCWRHGDILYDGDAPHEGEVEEIHGIGLFIFRPISSTPITLLNKAFGPEVSVAGGEYSLTFSPPSKEWDIYVNFLEFELLHAIAVDSTRR